MVAVDLDFAALSAVICPDDYLGDVLMTRFPLDMKLFACIAVP